MDMQAELETHIATEMGLSHPSFTVEVGVLHKALTVIRGAVEKSTAVPILSHVLMDVREGRLKLTGMDMEIAMIKTIPVNVRVPGRMAVPASMLTDTLSRMVQTGVADVVASDGSVLVKVGKSRVNITTLDPKDYPVFATTSLPTKIEIAGSLLDGAIAQVGFAMSSETSRQYLCGIYVHMVEPGELCMVATDGGSLAETKIPVGIREFPPIILPAKAIAQIKGCLTADVGVVQIEASDAQARFVFGNTELTTKLIWGAYPDYRRIIPAERDTPMIVAPSSLRQAVVLVSGISDNDKLRPTIFEVSDGALKLSSPRSERGDAVSELGDGDVNYTGDPVRVTMNGRALDTVLGSLAGDAEFHMTDGMSAVLVRDTRNVNVLFVLSALRY
jgi:DNA polymerase-3 subunit beta